MKKSLAWGAALGLGVIGWTRQSSAEPVFGLDATGSRIVMFDTADLDTLSFDRAITGLAAGEKITGIDFRPFTSQLYAVSNQNRVYTLSLASGGAVATQVGSGAFGVSDGSLGIDISPAFSGSIRVTTSDGTNIRINPDDGTLVGVDPSPMYLPGDPHFGVTPTIVGLAHDKNNRITFGTVTLYGIDATQDVLVRMNQTTGGLLTVGPLGISAGAGTGFDISGMTTNAYLHDGGTGFYTVDLTTGLASLVGTSGTSLSGIAVLPNVPLHWDVDANTAGVGGSGIWSTTAANWTYDSAGTGPNFGWINGPLGVSAIFRGASGVVTVESGVSIGSLTFESDGYVIQGSEPIDYRGSIINVVNAGDTATIAADLVGSATGSILKMGAGTLRVTGDVELTTGTSVLEGILAIDGGTFTTSGPLTVNLTAGLEIIHGGLAQTGQGIVGENEDAESTALVAGLGSRWENTSLLVGYSGNGTLSILDQAVVKTNGFASLALHAFGLNTAVVTVDGAGSLWFVKDNLTVGAQGTATMHIQNGGKVDSGDHSAMAVGPGSIAHVTVDGEGSLWKIWGTFEVATAGSATLEITNKGSVYVVQNGDVDGEMSIGGLSNLGFIPPSRGTVDVIGEGSLLSVEDNLAVGTLGHGELHILQGGAAEVGGSAAIGYDMLEFGDEIYRGTGAAVVDGPGSLWNVGEVLNVGFHGNGELTVSNGGVVTSGVAISVGTEEGSEGYIYIGDGGAPGTLDTPVISGGAGTAWLVFNHNAASYEFTPILTGTLALWQLGEGATILPYNNSFSGGTYIDAGRLVTQDAEALGNGYVEIAGGALAPVGTLNVDRLHWTGGRVAFSPAREDLLVVTHDIENGGEGGAFEIDPAGLQPGAVYTLATFDSTNLSLEDLRAVSFNANVSYQYAFQLGDHDVKVAILGATASGPLLQNGAPAYVPTFAHFTVNGPVITGPGEDTVIQSLTFGNGSSLQVNQTLTVTSGDFLVPRGKASISGGEVIVPGDFHKLGGGALMANADFQVEGNSFIHHGALHVNGTFQTPQLQVLPDGTLKGNGLIVGDVLNQGAVAPGNSIGTLSIRGDYTQSHQGSLEIEVGGLGNHDVLVVSGTARLGGALEIQDDGHDFEYGDQFAFLRAGRIAGRFGRIVMPDPDRLRGRFLAVGGTGILLVAPASYTLVAQAGNQARVARALDRWIGIEEGDVGEVTLGLDMLREEQYPGAFESIMPGRYAAAVELSTELGHSQLQGLHQQFASRRLEKRAWLEHTSESETSVMSSVSGKAAKAVVPVSDPVAHVETSGWRAWTQTSGLFSQTSWGTTPDDDFESGGFMAGGDIAVSESVTLGLFAGYQFGEGDYSGRNKLELEKFSFGGYATFDGEYFYAHAVVGGGATEYEVSRAMVLPTLSRAARSDPDGHEFFASFGVGHDVEVGDFTFGPSLTVQYNRQGLDAVDERGADSLNLVLDDASVDSLRTYLGARAAYTVRLGESSAIIPEVRAFWQHEFLQDGETFHAALDGGAGTGFDYVTEDPERDALFAGAGFNVLLGGRFSTSLFYHAEFGRTDDVNHTVSVNASWKF